MALGTQIRALAGQSGERGLTLDGRTVWQLASTDIDVLTQLALGDGSLIRAIPAPATSPYDHSCDHRTLWGLDSVSQKLYLVDVRDGSILRTLDTPSSLPTGLAWDGRTLWLADANLDKICQMDPRDGSVIRNFDTSDSVPTGLAWFGTALWLIGAALDDVIEMDLRDGTVKRSADTPSTGAQCMTADRRTLWTDDSGTHLIYQLSLN